MVEQVSCIAMRRRRNPYALCAYDLFWVNITCHKSPKTSRQRMILFEVLAPRLLLLTFDLPFTRHPWPSALCSVVCLSTLLLKPEWTADRTFLMLPHMTPPISFFPWWLADCYLRKRLKQNTHFKCQYCWRSCSFNCGSQNCDHD